MTDYSAHGAIMSDHGITQTLNDCASRQSFRRLAVVVRPDGRLDLSYVLPDGVSARTAVCERQDLAGGLMTLIGVVRYEWTKSPLAPKLQDRLKEKAPVEEDDDIANLI